MNTQLQISELNQEDLADVVRRAQAIDAEQVAATSNHQDLESFVRAAEEVGIRREAIMQALAEKVGPALEGLQLGDRVFAKSSDGRFYVATVKEIRGGLAVVRFVSGSDHTLPMTDLRAFSILPGQKIQVNWPKWGWWTVDVEAYDPEQCKLTCSDGWSTQYFTLTDVRQLQEVTRRQKTVRSLLFRVGLACAAAGGIAGAVIMRLFS